eukprot:TRINITY_DN10153_c0_g3_i1.p2 TRINITY_DN10153_c0_g3~~TRINITY_DN10153_c0_g3_i1.p2  ORF type:complete len:174 (-),score=34.15 TRINITY_DN10153_c0_g3_i1:859-1380(-)
MQRKQLYYADNSTRSANILNQSVGPAFYCPQYSERRDMRKQQKSIKTETASVQEVKPGPGAYSIRMEQVKPRVKGVSAWNKVASKRFSDPSNAMEEEGGSEVRAEQKPVSSYIYRKEMSSFASRVPRFCKNQGLRQVRREEVIMREASDEATTRLVIERSTRLNLESVLRPTP